MTCAGVESLLVAGSRFSGWGAIQRRYQFLKVRGVEGLHRRREESRDREAVGGLRSGVRGFLTFK